MKLKFLGALVGAVLFALAAPASAAPVDGSTFVIPGGSVTTGGSALDFAVTDFSKGVNGADFTNGDRYFDYIFSFTVTGPADVSISTNAKAGTNIFDFQTALFSSSPAGTQLEPASKPGHQIALVSPSNPLATGGTTLNALNLADGTYYLRLFGVITGNSDKNSLLKSLGGSFTATVAATPIPAALPLFASALGLVGFLGWRRKTALSAAAA